MSRWKTLAATFQEVGRHLWWRLSLGIVLPAYGIAHFVPALRGWPRAASAIAWFAVIIVLYADVGITYRRRPRAARCGTAGHPG